MLAASFPTGIGAGASETRPYQPATNLSIPFIPPHTAYPPSRLSSLTSCAHHLGKDSKGSELIDTVDIDTVKRYRSLPKISYPGTPASRIAHPSRLGLGLSGASMGFDHMDEFNPADFTTTANFPTSIISSLHHQPTHKHLRRWESHLPPTPCEKKFRKDMLTVNISWRQKIYALAPWGMQPNTSNDESLVLYHLSSDSEYYTIFRNPAVTGLAEIRARRRPPAP